MTSELHSCDEALCGARYAKLTAGLRVVTQKSRPAQRFLLSAPSHSRSRKRFALPSSFVAGFVFFCNLLGIIFAESLEEKCLLRFLVP